MRSTDPEPSRLAMYWRAAIDVIWRRESIATAIIATCIVTGADLIKSRYNDSENEKRQIIRQFTEKSREFDFYVSSYIYALVDTGTVDKEARRRLVENLIAQNNLLSDVKKTSVSTSLVMDYASALERMNHLIPDSDGVTKMKVFWEGASNVLEKRDALMNKLEY